MTDVVLFDLLTALLDSASLWKAVAGSEVAGRLWRAKYLELTYSCGRYRPYETLVREAALATGVNDTAAQALMDRWDTLEPWPEANAVLKKLKGHVRLGVVTNCSASLGQRAAARLEVTWDALVTAEEAGFYKPDPAPYSLALAQLKTTPERAAFVAGSAYDLFGTQRLGLRSYWHNRLAMTRPPGAAAPDHESSSLTDLPAWVLGTSTPTAE